MDVLFQAFQAIQFTLLSGLISILALSIRSCSGGLGNVGGAGRAPIRRSIFKVFSAAPLNWTALASTLQLTQRKAHLHM
jgi:hypothetical protein